MNRTIIICATSALIVTLIAIGPLQSAPLHMGVKPALTDQHTSTTDDEPTTRRERIREREVTPELAERIIEIAQIIDESLAERLRMLCDANPQEFERVIRQHRRLLALADLKESDPHLYDLKVLELQNERQVSILAMQIAKARQAEDGTREESLRQDLLNTLRINHAFSIRAREEYVKRLEQHLEALRAEVERDKNNFDAVVDRRMEEEILRAERALAIQATTANRER